MRGLNLENFENIQETAEFNFNYLNKKSTLIEETRDLSSKLISYPIDRILTSGKIYEEFDEKLIKYFYI